MPTFGNAYSDAEIAALANDVTSRFGSKGSRLTAQDMAELRKQTSECSPPGADNGANPA
jgi:mono/diheme cytochrome c family protein